MAFKGTDPKTAGDDIVKAEEALSDAQLLQAERPKARISDDVLREISDFDAAIAAATEAYGELRNFAEEFGTGFDPVDKAIFVNKTTALVEWRFSEGDWGGFVSAIAVAKDGSKGIINDGSSGVYEQLKMVSADTGQFGGWLLPKGLRVSEYDTCLQCGRPRPSEDCEYCGDDKDTKRGTGRTYYLDTAQS